MATTATSKASNTKAKKKRTRTASKDYIGDKSKPDTPRPKGGPSGAVSKRKKRSGEKKTAASQGVPHYQGQGNGAKYGKPNPRPAPGKKLSSRRKKSNLKIG